MESSSKPRNFEHEMGGEELDFFVRLPRNPHINSTCKHPTSFAIFFSYYYYWYELALALDEVQIWSS